MSPSCIVLLAAALVGAEPQPSGDTYAEVFPRDMLLGAGPAEELAATLFGVLPSPPTIILRQTHYYGAVTIDHRAHLQRRISCKSCHGPKPVGKIAFTPRVAHDRCVGCHQTVAKGPTKCQGCHVKSATPPPMLVATSASAAAAAEPPKPPEPNPGNVAAALAAFDSPKGGAGGGAAARDPLHRWLEVGLAVGHGLGPSAVIVTQQDRVLLAYAFERMGSDHDTRTFGLFGVGFSRPVHSRVSLNAVGFVGLDVLEKPMVDLFPAIGARAGAAVRTRYHIVQQLSASITGVVDLSSKAFEPDVGGFTIYGTLSTGFSL